MKNEDIFLRSGNDGYKRFFDLFLNNSNINIHGTLLSLLYGYNDKKYISKCKEECENFWTNNHDNSNDNFSLYYRASGKKSENIYKKIYEIGFSNKCIASHDQGVLLNHVINISKAAYKSSKNKILVSNFKKNYFKNYSLCHIYDGTKNPFLYTLPWNYMYIPTPIAPLSDNICIDNEYQILKSLKSFICENYKDEIKKYNTEITEVFKKIFKDENLKDNLLNQYRENKNVYESIKNQFYTINANNTKIKYLFDYNKETDSIELL